jgi:putative transposase
MPDDPIRIHRRSIRLKEYDYTSPGAYFVTVVTQGYKCIFGKIIDKEMHLNVLGKIVQEYWLEILDHFPDIDVEPFVIMPNHIHGIVTIYDNDRSGTIYRAPTMGDHAPVMGEHASTNEKFGQPVVGSIPTIIRTYKAAVSRLARRELGMVKIWQRNYYEHIIRDQSDLESLAGYIHSNPDHWSDDPEYTQ